MIGACEIKVHHYNAAFSQVTVGNSEALTVARMGAPAVRERAAQPYLRYAISGCTKPCAIRLWWEKAAIRRWRVGAHSDRSTIAHYRPQPVIEVPDAGVAAKLPDSTTLPLFDIPASHLFLSQSVTEFIAGSEIMQPILLRIDYAAVAASVSACYGDPK